MFDDILIPTDGSEGAEAALARAFDLARTGDARLHTLYVRDTRADLPGLGRGDLEGIRDRTERRGRDATASVQTQAAEHDLDVVRESRDGTPTDAILGYVDDAGIDLVVMGTRGRSGSEQTRLGSTTERVVARADVPVMAVRLGESVPRSGYGMYDHVLVPTDGSDAARRAADHAIDVAEAYGADVHVVYVVDTTIPWFQDAESSIVGLLTEGGEAAVEEIAAAARDRSLPVTTDVLRGVPHEAILEYATGVDADLVAMGSRGRSDTGHLLGSTTAHLLRRSAIPVLATR